MFVMSWRSWVDPEHSGVFVVACVELGFGECFESFEAECFDVEACGDCAVCE